MERCIKTQVIGKGSIMSTVENDRLEHFARNFRALLPVC